MRSAYEQGDIANMQALAHVTGFDRSVLSRILGGKALPRSMDRRLAGKDPRYQRLFQVLELDSSHLTALVEEQQRSADTDPPETTLHSTDISAQAVAHSEWMLQRIPGSLEDCADDLGFVFSRLWDLVLRGLGGEVYEFLSHSQPVLSANPAQLNHLHGTTSARSKPLRDIGLSQRPAEYWNSFGGELATEAQRHDFAVLISMLSRRDLLWHQAYRLLSEARRELLETR